LIPERDAARGLVVALQANYCRVQLDRPGPGGIERLLCIRRTRLGKTGQQIRVGDRVELDGLDWSAGRAAVSALLPRDSLLERPAVANCSRVVVVIALTQPVLDPLQLTRFLLTAEATGEPVEVVLTKADLLPETEVWEWRDRLSAWGYAPVAVSVQTGQGLDLLRDRLSRAGISVLCGPSGVGKSSLLNALLPDLRLPVGQVSGRLQRGRHTTRHVELFPLAPGALLADTPGFNRPELPADPRLLPSLFPEVRRALHHRGCRFGNCLHQGDPGCAVGTAWDRSPLYGQCLQEVLDRGAATAERDTGGLKQRGARLEPRLEPRWRRPSRRRQRQEGAGEGISSPDPGG
jgi:ribosome biogenesis GTPase